MITLSKVGTFTALLLMLFSTSILAEENSDYTNYGSGSLSGTNDAGADNNTAIGQGAMSGNLTSAADYNTAVGYRSLYTNTTGSNNTASGKHALYANTTGANNTASGASALRYNTTGTRNTASGSSALFRNTTGTNNTASGYHALLSNTTGNHNTASGMWALYSNTTGISNTASGMNALYSNTSGNYNSASGKDALSANTTGSYNTASGNGALTSNTTGISNTASGMNALYSNTSGNYNSASGKDALSANTTGSYNAASGNGALTSNTTGGYNTASGTNALYSNTTGSNNLGLGYQSGHLNQTGSKNVFIGYQAGYNETGSDKLYIDNSSTSTPLIYGDFANDALTVNGTLAATGSITTSGTLTALGNIATEGTLTAKGNITAPAIYHTNGTKMLSLENGEVHLGPTSMIFTDSTISGNADIMSSAVGKVQIGKTATDSTTVVGSLSVQTPTAAAHAANKNYVDTLRKDARRYDSRSVALSAALTALPTNGGTGSHTCGVGAGVRGEYTAMALGCAADLANFKLPNKLPAFIKNASVNAGTSFLAHDDPDYTFKMGMSFNFGGSKSKSNASNFNTDFARELALVEQRNLRTDNKQAEAIKNVQKDNHQIRQDNRQMKRVNLKVLAENKNLQAQIDVLIASQADMLVMKEQLAQLTALIAGSEMVAVK